MRPSEPRIVWGGLALPASVASSHFLVAGTTGSGKTVTVNLLLKSVLPHIAPGSDWRALIYDAKTEIVSQLGDMGLRCPIHILNPLDARSAAWHMARDLRTPEEIREASILLFPPPKEGKNDFFDKSAANLLEGVMHSFKKRTPGAWDLRDILLAMGSKARLKEVLSWAPEHNADRIELYFGNARTANDIMATIANQIAPYRVIAAYWHNSPRRVSLEDWAKGESILIMGNSHRATEALRDINRVMFRRLSQIILDVPNSTPRRSWIFLDEFAKAGRLDGLDELMTKGRSKGVSAVLAFQDISGVKEVYGDNIAEEMMAQVGSKAILRLQGSQSAKWAEATFGDEEITEFRFNESQTSTPQGGSASSGLSEHRDVHPIVRAAEFLAIPHAGQPGVSALSGFYNTAQVGPYRYDLPLALVAKHFPPRRGFLKLADFEERPASQGYLEPWTREELARLGLHSEPSQAPAPGRSIEGLDLR